MRNNDTSATFGFIAILIVAIIVLWIIESCVGASKYNGGICKLCGGNYVFQNAVGHRYETNYVYICDKCGNMIEVNTYYHEGKD